MCNQLHFAKEKADLLEKYLEDKKIIPIFAAERKQIPPAEMKE